jgi:hypothetical protein
MPHATRLGQTHHFPSIVFEEVDNLADIQIGLGPLLARLERLPSGELKDPPPGRWSISAG